MDSVFSHIIQKRFSNSSEDVATDALEFLLSSSASARQSMLSLLRSVCSDIGDLTFITQQSEDHVRPDMWGIGAEGPEVFIENKFWAGLTDNQPRSYLSKLAASNGKLLLFVAPEARQHSLWMELLTRLAPDIEHEPVQQSAHQIVECCKTSSGPVMALTTWRRLLNYLNNGLSDDVSASANIAQIQALCEAADNEAFLPLSASQLSDLRIPELIKQLVSVVNLAAELGHKEGLLSFNGLRPQADWDRTGRYILFHGRDSVGAWIGIHFEFLKSNGETPIWLYFENTHFGRGMEVQQILEPWENMNQVPAVRTKNGFGIALLVLSRKEQSEVAKDLVEKVRSVSILSQQLCK